MTYNEVMSFINGIEYYMDIIEDKIDISVNRSKVIREWARGAIATGDMDNYTAKMLSAMYNLNSGGI
jgi:hypothetical protein